MALPITDMPASPAPGVFDHGFASDKINEIIGSAIPEAPAGSAPPSMVKGTNFLDASVLGNERCFTWDTDTTATAPSPNGMKGNNATLSAITQIYLDATLASGVGLGELLKRSVTEDFGAIGDFENQSNGMIFRFTGPAVDNGGWFTIPVQSESALGSFASGTRVSAEYWATGHRPQQINIVSTTEFTQASPVVGTIYDTGYDPAGKVSSERIGVNLLVTSGGIQRGVFSSVRASSLIAFPNVRVARTTEFTSAPGDVTMEFWYDTLTTPGAPTVKTEVEVDGGGKTLDSLVAISSFEQIVTA